MINGVKEGLKLTGLSKRCSRNQALKLLLFQKRKGQISSLFTAFIVVVFLGIIIFAVANLGDKFLTGLADNSEAGTLENELVSQEQGRFPEVLQMVFLVIFFGLGVTTLISSFLVRNFPILTFLMVILLVVLVFASPVLANVYDGFANTQENGALSERMGIMKYVFDWYPKIMLALSVVAIIVMFAKGGGEG